MQEYRDALRRVTADDVQRGVRTLLTEEKATWIELVPAAAAQRQPAPSGP